MTPQSMSSLSVLGLRHFNTHVVLFLPFIPILPSTATSSNGELSAAVHLIFCSTDLNYQTPTENSWTQQKSGRKVGLTFIGNAVGSNGGCHPTVAPEYRHPVLTPQTPLFYSSRRSRVPYKILVVASEPFLIR